MGIVKPRNRDEGCLWITLLAVTDAFIKYGRCFGSDLGTETVKESWSCKADGGAKCEREKTTCGCDGESITVGGYIKYDSRGIGLEVGEGWNCFNKCQWNRRSSGTQSKISTKGC